MAKYIKIGGYDFKVVRPRTRKPVIDTACIDIYKAYKYPSRQKVAIYHDLERKIASVEGVRFFGVAGAGCFQFSVSFEYTDTERNVYACKVTASSKTAYLLN